MKSNERLLLYQWFSFSVVSVRFFSKFIKKELIELTIYVSWEGLISYPDLKGLSSNRGIVEVTVTCYSKLKGHQLFYHLVLLGSIQ